MNIIIGNAWPYANGSLHLGRIAVLLPGDILARYHRLMGDDVIFLSGTDCHGTPVTMKAEEEGITPIEAVNKYHKEFIECFNKLNFSFDIFSKTHSNYHEERVESFILKLYNEGYIYEDRESGHLMFALSKVENDVRRIFIKQNGWRDNAQKIIKRYLDEGLRDRAVTRDVNWGVNVPISGYEDKKIYVWIEAVMGYLTATMEVVEARKESFDDYWQGEDSRIYFVHGKDNIPFHTVIFPGILSGLGIKNPNLRIISSEYLKLEGKNFSGAKNWALWVDYMTANYNPDMVRYYLALNSPEESDKDFTWRDFINTINTNLFGLLGNFVNKTLLFIERNFNSRIPQGQMDKKIQDEILNLYFDIGDYIEVGEFNKSLQEIFKIIKKMNKFFDDEKPWETINNDLFRCKNTVYTCFQTIVNISNLLEPFIPETCDKIRAMTKHKEAIWSYSEIKDGRINEVKILFDKIDKNKILEESKRLKSEKF